MGEDNRGRVQFQAAFHHFTRVDAGAINGPGKQDFAVDDTVPVVQEQAGEHFMWIAAQPGFDVGLGLVGIAQHRPGAHVRFEKTPAQL